MRIVDLPDNREQADSSPANKAKLNNANKTDRELEFEAWNHVASIDARKEAVEFISNRRGVQQIIFLLRQSEHEHAIWLNNNLSQPDKLRRGLDCRLELFTRLKNQWQRYGSNHHFYQHMQLLPVTGQCIVRAPADDLIRFLECDDAFDVRSPISGIILNESCAVPERDTEKILAANGHDPHENFAKVEARLKKCSHDEFAYFDDFGVAGLGGLIRRHSGVGRTVTIIDSGCDESHPAHQQSITEFKYLDAYGNEKPTHYASDAGCHGTKVQGAIMARPIDNLSLGIEIPFRLRFGVAPGAAAISIKALGGDACREGGTAIQIGRALEYVACRRVGMSSHNSSGIWTGPDICNLSASIVTSPDRTRPKESAACFDRLLDRLQSYGVAVLLASGNGPHHSSRLGTKGVYVGACDSKGKVWDNTLAPYDLLLPGVDVICTQPSLPILGSHLLGEYSGTSFSTATLSGIVAVLSECANRPALEVVEALQVTAKESRQLDLEEAERWLKGS
ncbi:MAG: S8 family serine peptidase [Planctomycetaceae bacterium]|nr:S8 family serine peptidase [Planctomycetaceae bacterium]